VCRRSTSRCLGRWIGHFPRDQFVHDSIGKAAALRNERIIGWSAHYAIGVLFAAVLVAVWGLNGRGVRLWLPPDHSARTRTTLRR
jgi:hypothetical protein